MTEKIVIPELVDTDQFKEQSLLLFAQNLKQQTYPGYPDKSQRLCYSGTLPEVITLPDGPWWVKANDYLSAPEPGEVEGRFGLDSAGRPLHPWFAEMIQSPNTGVVCGKGFYWNWGPNYTADPVVIRRDLGEPHVLLIERMDGTGWALPGGFIDGQESSVAAAVREAYEEAGIDLTLLSPEVDIIYTGPVADLRMTAHAWAETTAVRFELSDAVATQFTVETWQGGDDARTAAWVPASQLKDRLFGSHGLLVESALGSA